MIGAVVCYCFHSKTRGRVTGQVNRVRKQLKKNCPAMASAQSSGTSVKEYVIRVPKAGNKKYHVMRFNSVLNVDFSKWNQVKMERENNMKEFRGMDDEMPKFGAGSEFGRDQREEARRKKFGIITKKYKPEDQPWILKVGGKTGKKFKGIREGGVGENAAYYVFTHAPDGAIEAFPLTEWYNFKPIQRYKALSAEEAEQEFGRRNKVMNYFSLMMRKRLRNDEDGDFEEMEEGRKGGKGGGKGSKGKGELKISEMDDWIDSESGEDESEGEGGEKDEENDKEKPKKGAKGKEKAKKKRRDSNDEAVEESDDGDEEGREVDYISDSSDSEIDLDENVKDSMKGVAEEDALRKLLDSEEEDDEEKEGRGDEDGEDGGEEGGEKDKDGGGEGGKGESDGEGPKKKKGGGGKGAGSSKKDSKKKDPSSVLLDDSSSNYSSDSSDIVTKKKPSKKEANSSTTKGNSGSQDAQASSSSTSGASESNKRKADPDSTNGAATKKPRLKGHTSFAFSDSGITEEAVRRYLMRKPMTTTELLQKFKSKKTGLSSDQLVNVMTQILKRINPIKQTIKGKMYLSIKA
ncbi:general transcription factor IIF subunit 1-like isoform X2 [Hetaerina americana]|uniref:general transcription factor IIF subunit 1-like isoform X2 n=1 Tax=Hetaerina americana TaxID=62018 RepID=UPI003A7F3B1B